MPTEKLITFESDGDKSDSIYYVQIDVDGKRQREEMDKKKQEKKSKMDKGHVQRPRRKSNYFHDTKSNGIKRTGEEVEVKEFPKERNSSENKKTKKQQGITEKEEEEEKNMEMKQKNYQGKMKKRRKWPKDCISDASSSSDEELVVDSLSEEEMEKLIKAIDERKKLIATLKAQPWPMRKKMSTLRKSQAFIEKYEGILGKTNRRRLYTCKAMMTKKWMKFQRHFNNFKMACVPWEMKIKEIESHFGSAVASYFILLRWMFGINIILFCLSFGLVMFPEALMGLPYGSIPRKTIPREEQAIASNLDIIWDIEGYLKYSIMFYGYYNNQRTIGWLRYQMPLCYFLVGVAGMAYNFMVVIKTMARNTSEDSGEDDNNFNYSWKIFTSWDYLVGNPDTANSKFAYIATTFKEVLCEEKLGRKDESIRMKVFIGVTANILVLFILGGSGYLIYFVVHRSEKFIYDGMNHFSWWERNEVNIVMSLLTTFIPMLFDAIGIWENYHPRITLRLQLARVFTLYVGNLYSFIIAIIDQISISRGQEEAMKLNLTIWEANMYNKSLAQNSTGVPIRVDPADVPRGPCWETMVGQEFVRMLISDTVTTYVVILINDFARAVIIRCINHCWCWDLEYTFPCYSLFDVSGNVLTLIFNQGMTCMGTFYAPCLPALNIIRLQTSMYLQSWGVMCCNMPHPRIFKASRCSNSYMSLQLLILFVSTLPTIFTIVALRPSFDCGPFSGKDRMYDVIPESLQTEFPKWLATAFSYLSNPGLVVPFLLFLILTIYYLYATSKSFKRANTDLKTKLRIQREENRNWNKHVARKTAEQAQEDKQSNNNASIKATDTRKSSGQSSYLTPPPHFYNGDQGSDLKFSPRCPYVQTSAPQSHLIHGQLPGFPPY